jgi:hypothetical protein
MRPPRGRDGGDLGAAPPRNPKRKRGPAMRMINGNRRRLLCNPGEIVTVTVTSGGTVHNVAMSLNGHDFNAATFTVDTRTDLIILGIFSNDTGGGQYNIRLTGSGGGDQVDDSIVQGDGELARKEGTRGYIFTIG